MVVFHHLHLFQRLFTWSLSPRCQYLDLFQCVGNSFMYCTDIIDQRIGIQQSTPSKMMMIIIKTLSFLLLIALLNISYSAASSSNPEPQIFRSFRLKSNLNKTSGNCGYTVVIKTSCSSPSYTRDRVSLAFGDQYGNEVYASRLDDPRSGTFERCSTDTFQINGPCTYDICYQYLLRSGSDGWKPESVQITGPNRKPAKFYYNAVLPNGVWFGYNSCHRRGGSTKTDEEASANM